jgi:GT2 family glycosyltransferase
MDAVAPPVVAVVVAHDPGPWFEESLASIAAQDYSELSLLVLDTGSAEDLTERVARVVPSAYVRRFEDNCGFGAAVNHVPSMVAGAAYYLLCHDDVALFPDAVHLLVEEAFRSNAGVVAPKVVDWDDPSLLVHVGMAVDKGGSVEERVHPHELDQGQHDAVRDVFLAPGGCNLVRADLFDEVGGFDPAIVAMGEDLDFCWRAQVVGARVIVAPDARVRHREELAGGARTLEASLWAGGDEGTAKGPAPTLQELQRRHELLCTLKCYGRFHLARVLPQVAVLSAGEVVVAEVSGHRPRARAVVRAWRWNLGRLGALRTQRAELRSRRRLHDSEVRELQMRGSARLSSYGRRVFQHGFHGALADELAGADDARALAEPPAHEGDGVVRLDPTSERGRLSPSTRLVAWLAAALVIVVGSRNLITGRLPAVGQFSPFPGWGATFSQFIGGWHPAGVGTTAPATPALALVGVLGTVLLGAMGLAEKVVVLACVPLGVWGVVRLVRPFGSQRASLVAGLAYLAMALPYDALGTGRLGALVLYAGAPWVLANLFRASGLAPYERSSGDGGAASGRRPTAETAAGGSSAALVAVTGALVRRRDVLLLGLLEAVLVAFAPAAVIVVLLAGGALAVPLLATGARRAAGQVVARAVGATVAAAVISLPWVIGVLSAGTGAVSVFGVPLAPSAAVGWGSLLRFSDGPIGDSVLGWGFALAALAPLLLGRGPRFGWASRLWMLALVFWVSAWMVGRGWTGRLAPDLAILLAPAAVAAAAAIGLGVAAFEEDVPRATFGWRQLVTGLAATATVLAAVPTVVSAAPGSWNLPSSDFAQALAWMPGRAATGAFRVLWLADPRALNLGGWSAGGGLAYATSEEGPPDARWLWNQASPGPAADLAAAVDLARGGGTDRVGGLLAPAGVRYVVVLGALAPQIAGEQTPESLPLPADLLPAFDRQLDLTPVLSGTGMTVFQNADWVPSRAEIPQAGPAGTIQPVLPGPPAATSFAGPLVAGTVLASVAPSGRFALDVGGRPAPRAGGPGWEGRYAVGAPGQGVLAFGGGPWAGVAFAYSLVLWIGLVAVLVGRRRVEAQWSRMRHRRPRATAPRSHDGDWDPFGESSWAESEAGTGVRT